MRTCGLSISTTNSAPVDVRFHDGTYFLNVGNHDGCTLQLDREAAEALYTTLGQLLTDQSITEGADAGAILDVADEHAPLAVSDELAPPGVDVLDITPRQAPAAWEYDSLPRRARR